MSEHWYKNGKLADHSHADWPKTKAGTPRVTPSKAMMVGLGFKPSVTSILSVIGAYGGLMHWYAQKGRDALLELIREGGFSLGLFTMFPEEEWKDRLKSLTTAAAEEGTRFHKCIEDFLTTEEKLPDDRPARQAAINVYNWIESRGLSGGKKEHIVEVDDPYLEDRGVVLWPDLPYAGTVDYWTVKDGVLWVIDIKTKNTKRDCRPKWDHAAQLAAYADAIIDGWVKSQERRLVQERVAVDEFRCVNLYISRETGEIGKEKVWTDKEIRKGRELFEQACSVWLTMNTEKIT